MLASEEWAQANGKEALAEIVAHAQSANDFAYLATTPASAAKKALEKAGLQPGDIDLWEINEAFASVTLNSIRMLGIDEDASTSTAARSRSATRSAPRARASSAASCTSCAAAAAARLRGDLLGRRAGRRGDPQGTS